MSYDLRIEKRDDVLWVTATGTRSLDTIMAMSRDILAACAENGTTKALIDVRAMEGHLRTVEAYEIAGRRLFAIRDRSVITRGAIIDLKEFEHSYKFFEDVAVNRGLALRIFSDPGAALEWLKG